MFGMLLVPRTIMRSLAVGAILVGDRLRARGADAAAGAARPARRPRQRAAHARSSAALASSSEPGGALLGRDRARASCAGRSSASWLVGRRCCSRWPLPVARPEARRERRHARCPTGFASKQGFVALAARLPAATSRARRRSSSPATRRAAGRRRRSRGCERDARGRSALRRAATLERSAGRRRRAALGAGSAATRRATQAIDAVRELRVDDRPGGVRGHGRRRCSSAATTAENVDYFDAMIDLAAVVFAFVLGLTLRPADGRLPLDRRRRAPRSSSTCSRSAPPTACSCSSSSTASAPACSASSRCDAIEAWVPLFLFSVLFGLSMDYQVFLLSRIRERYDQTGATRRTRSRCGVASTARHHHRRGADHRRRLRRLRAWATWSCSSRWASASPSRC